MVLVLVLVVAAFGCGGLFGQKKRVATPAELDQMGTRTYPGYGKNDVVKAAVTALKVQGYEIVANEPRIRTSPKLVHVSSTSSYGQFSGSSRTYGESVAWDIDVKEAPAGTTLHAVPRASVNGMAMEQMYYDYASTTFTELMKEIDASLPAKK
jgi:hypothetical protein